MTSLVIGATGMVGGHIVDELVRAGERPMALSRAARPDTAEVAWFAGDLAAPTALKLPPFTTLYCTAYAGLLAKALPDLACASLQRVVALTSTSLVTKINSEVAAERESMREWARAESELIEACQRLGISWTVLRPTMIYDEGRDANVTRLSRLIERVGVMPLAGNGAGLRQPVHARDLAAGAVAAAASAVAANKIYAVPGTDTISYREMVGRIFDGLNRRRRVVAIPMAVWKAALALAQPFVRDANVAMGSRMAKDMVFDASPAIRDFGWNPREFRPRFDRSASARHGQQSS
ncbi:MULTISPECIES: epimerase [Rhodopseudomonas]|uniref:Epimerase n=1 Tax=Rhodopseudomonas palustris TaxID=1076 RepID=A0A0D7F0T9_RHOPL|nr:MULTISPECIES: epimerase [Rhodopseudomonas]KIZ45317.1 epimerase [Rhodopseudomonas palustris]MDF3809983.1 epimerase [Rhodopseudomonas sp. BAL398]WOK20459.1 epimerase [Rhodopseudomonas sp. BAL398]